jgi:hypothetical protein
MASDAKPVIIDLSSHRFMRLLMRDIARRCVLARREIIVAANECRPDLVRSLRKVRVELVTQWRYARALRRELRQ